MSRKLVQDLAQRLFTATLLTPNNTRPEFVDEQWMQVAETIDLMIDKAILELKIELVNKAPAQRTNSVETFPEKP